MSEKNTPSSKNFSEERFRLIFEYVPLAIWEEDYSAVLELKKTLTSEGVTDVLTYLQDNPRIVLAAFRQIHVLDVNKQAVKLYGAKSKEELLTNLDKTIQKEVITIITDEFAALINGANEFEATFKTKRLDGELRDVKMRVVVPDIYQATLEKAIITLQDITIEKEHERHLQKLAQTDGLTNVYNHKTILERLHVELLRAHRYNIPLSALMIDLDYFKGVNDLCGHQKGDEVLQKVAATLVACVREVDIVGRYGGDEFLVILPQTSKKQAFIVADRLKRAFEKLTERPRDGTMYSTISVGISGIPDESIKTAEDFVLRIDKAMYQAKKEGRNRIATK